MNHFSVLALFCKIQFGRYPLRFRRSFKAWCELIGMTMINWMLSAISSFNPSQRRSRHFPNGSRITPQLCKQKVPTTNSRYNASKITTSHSTNWSLLQSSQLPRGSQSLHRSSSCSISHGSQARNRYLSLRRSTKLLRRTKQLRCILFPCQNRQP
jgi:hypothetical protein